MPLKGRRRRSRRRLLLLLVAYLIAVVGFGAPTVAYAEPTPSASDTAAPDATKAAAPSAEKADPSASPTAAPSADPTKSAESSATPSEEPTSASPAPKDEASAEPSDSESTSPSATPDKAATKTPAQDEEPGRVAPRVVPGAQGDVAVITVKVAGNRTSLNAIGGLAGVQLGFYDTQTGTTPAFTCTSDADGDCSISVPNTGGTSQNPQANRDRRFWVRQISTASGYYQNSQLGTGETVAANPYRFQTGTELRAGQTYFSTDDFMIGTGNSNNNASSGLWQNSLDNPEFPAKCGINVALVLDLSGSVGSDLGNLKTAARTFVNSLQGTPSAVGVFTFASAAPANGSANTTLALTPVSTAAGATTVNTKINGLTLGTGQGAGTNWDRGIYQVAQSSSDFDVAVVITDGNPTFYGATNDNGSAQGPGSRTRFREVENGIYSANAVKAENTKVIAFGVGSGINNAGSGLNLRAISGETLNDDYYQTSDYQAAGDQLKALALGNCTGSITVVKEVVPSDTPANSTAGATPQGGWTFTGTTSAAGVGFDDPNVRQTASGTGAANFPLTFSGGATTGDVTLTETQQAGYTLHPIDGNNATCTRVDTGATVPSSNSNDTGFTVQADSGFPISCTVYNQAPQPLASVVLHKRWSINGLPSVPDGSQPDALVATATLDGDNAPWEQEQTGYRSGQSISVGEATDISGLPLCTLTSALLTDANGTTVSLGLPSSQTLQGGVNNYTITNAVSCDTRLKLTKTVDGGVNPPPASDWTLFATTRTGAAGPSGTTGVNGSVTPLATYTLSENNPHPEYLQFVDPNAELAQGSSGSWNCQQVEEDGETVIPGFQDGLNGNVNVPFGTYVRCNAVNQTAVLGMIKEVDNNFGGTAEPSDWTLHATPTGDIPAGLQPVTQTGTDAANVVYVNVRPRTTYLLTETPVVVPGYRLVSTQCSYEGRQRSPITDVFLQPGFTATCWFTNQDQPSHLSLVKHVENDDTGGTLGSSDFILSAIGPSTVIGPGNSGAVTDQQVLPGDYDLSEVGVAGYTASDWTCTGGTLTGSSVNVPLGGDVTCEITNTAQQAHLTLVKTVTNDNGGTAEATDWTLSATGGPTGSISGPTGDTAVTDVPVAPGAYDLAESGGPAGYAAGEWSCVGGEQDGASVQVRLGDDVTCTINNDDTAALLTLVKVVDNGDTGATYEPADWTLTATGATTVTGPGNSPAVTGQPVGAGTYALAESGGPDGYTASDWSCTGGELTGTSVVVPNGGDVTCTITNTAQPATLTLVKVVDNGDTGAAAAPADWTLSAAGPDTVTGDGNSPEVTDQTVQVGDYDLSEAGGPDGYTASDWVCTGADVSAATSVTVAPGDDVTCTITNTAIAPTLTLIKVVDNGDTGATTEATAWTLTAVNGASTISGVTGNGDVTGAAAIVGTYDLSESGPPGYDASDWVCTGGQSSSATSVTLGLDDDATCTITNTAGQPRLTLIKTVTNDDGGTAEPTDWTLSATGPTPDVVGRVGDDSVTNVPVEAGTYLLGEGEGPAGYTPGDWSCTGGSLDGSVVSIALGDDVTCTINNDDQPAKLTLRKVVDNGDTGATHGATDWTLTASGPTPGISGSMGDPAVTGATVDAGDYTLSESGPSGYTAGAWSCGEGAQVTDGVVTVPLGGDVTCAILNTAQPGVWRLAKTSDPATGSTVDPGDEITYTVTATKVSGVDPTDLTVTDDLSDVVNHAVLVSGPTASTGTAVVSGTTMTWSIPTLSDEATLTYTVRVNDDAYGVELANVVTGSGSETCAEPGDGGRAAAVQGRAAGVAADDEECETHHDTPPPPNEPNLPNTGGPGLAVVGIGSALVIGGGGLMLWTRRRRTD
ncbi:hypothetical protein GCM10022236_20050 [Microlunatus ginsengisoli]|uniref:VWFA domain-containing protein n=1 Tax=Microlunatus ginsengisoli TaxID=363863 RepID=A0ABP6ZTQ7_9ACTN